MAIVGHTLMRSKLVATFTVVFAVVGAAGCLNRSDDCRNKTSQQIGSPGGKMKAVIFVHVCRAAKPITELSVLPSEDKLLANDGNVFVADTEFGIDVSWTNGTELLVKYDKQARVVRNESSIGDVRVRYETVSR